jgi:hypothetical protein
MKRTPAGLQGKAASKRIDERVAELGDWRGEMLQKVRGLLKEVDPKIVEEWKWMGTPVFSRDGILCTGETYKSVVKLTFAKGAFLPDPSGLFNSSLDGNMRRAIDIKEGEKLKVPALKALVRSAIALNAKKNASSKKTAPKEKAAPKARSAKRGKR